jgi:hypothetical protein
VDTHESLETIVNAGVAAGTSQFNRTLVICFKNPPHHKGFSKFAVKTYKIAAFLQYLFSGNKT